MLHQNKTPGTLIQLGFGRFWYLGM